VQYDYDAMRPIGVTNHYSRIFTPNAKLTNETFRAGISVISDNVMDAVKSVMTCQPDYLVMAMSAITFFGGAKGADTSGLPPLVTTLLACAVHSRRPGLQGWGAL
jgi:maleate isomerase